MRTWGRRGFGAAKRRPLGKSSLVPARWNYLAGNETRAARRSGDTRNGDGCVFEAVHAEIHGATAQNAAYTAGPQGECYAAQDAEWNVGHSSNGGPADPRVSRNSFFNGAMPLCPSCSTSTGISSRTGRETLRYPSRCFSRFHVDARMSSAYIPGHCSALTRVTDCVRKHFFTCLRHLVGAPRDKTLI